MKVVKREGNYLIKQNKSSIIDTQQYALDFYRKHNIPHVPADYRRVDKNTIKIKYYDGTPLSELDTKTFNSEAAARKWWVDIIGQIFEYLVAMAEHRACHNDLWDNNVIVTPDNKVIIIDHEYFTSRDHIPAAIMTASRAEKRRMGWSTKYRIGSDSNQILGHLLAHPTLPRNIRRFISKRVIRVDKEFPYAIVQPNKKLSPAVVSAYLRLLQ